VKRVLLARRRSALNGERNWIYLHFQHWERKDRLYDIEALCRRTGSTLARFRLSWAARGERIGDGTVPDWVL
jgi:hypothetical protein